MQQPEHLDGVHVLAFDDGRVARAAEDAQRRARIHDLFERGRVE